MKITALKQNSKLTGEFQKGDFSKHKDYCVLKHVIYNSYEDFKKELDFQNFCDNLKPLHEEYKPNSNPMSIANDDNYWK